MVPLSIAFYLIKKEKGEELAPALSTFLKEDKNYYKKVAEQHLNPYRDRQFLKKFKDLWCLLSKS